MSRLAQQQWKERTSGGQTIALNGSQPQRERVFCRNSPNDKRNRFFTPFLTPGGGSLDMHGILHAAGFLTFFAPFPRSRHTDTLSPNFIPPPPSFPGARAHNSSLSRDHARPGDRLAVGWLVVGGVKVAAEADLDALEEQAVWVQFFLGYRLKFPTPPS